MKSKWMLIFLIWHFKYFIGDIQTPAIAKAIQFANQRNARYVQIIKDNNTDGSESDVVRSVCLVWAEEQ